MTNRRSTRAGRGSSGMWPVLIVLVLLIAVGTTTTLWATGYFEEAESHEGKIPFPTLTRPVKAYERITREDLINLQTQSLGLIWIDEDQVTPKLLGDLSQIIGRVLARDKSPGYIFTESDFLPVGTRPGVTAGVPPGKRSLSLPVDKVPGLELLRQGDTFDLLASLPSRTDPVSNIEPAKLLGGIKPPDTRSGQLARQTGIKPLVLGGTMVALTQGSTQSTVGSQSLVVDAGVAASRRNQKEIIATIAVDPEEVTPLTEALGLDVDLYCVARSGHAEETSETKEQMSFDGMVPVVATARDVDAYSALGPHDLADTVTGRLNVYYFPPDRIEPDWITDFGSLVGRVVARDIPPGSVLNEDLLLPPGTRAGLSAGAPPGTVVLPVAVDELKGLDSLSNGDRFAIYVRLPEAMRPSFPQTDWATLHGGRRPDEDEALQQELRTGVRRVVADATFIGDVDSQPDSDEDAERFVGIAVAEATVTPLSQFLKKGSELFVVAESGRSANPDDAPPSVADTPSEEPQEWQVAYQPDAEPGNQQPGSATRDEQGSLVSVPVTARPIAAYSKLKVEDFIDPATGRPRVMLFPAERVGADWIRDLSELVDRVVTRDIDASRVIDRSAVLPAGSQPGPTAGVPTGMKGLMVNGQQVLGLDGLALERGDHFQLVVARPYNVDSLGGTVRRGLTNGDATEQALAAGGLFEKAIVEPLCNDVRLVDFGGEVTVVQRNVVNETHTTTETHPTPDGPVRVENRTVTPQVSVTDVSTKSYLLAVSPAELAGLTEALAVEAKVIAVPLPGTSESIPSPVAAPNVASSKASPGASPKIVEHIRGNEVTREVWLTPDQKAALPAHSHELSSGAR